MLRAFLAAVAMLLALPALAESPGSFASPVDWTGPYAGVQFGTGVNRTRKSATKTVKVVVPCPAVFDPQTETFVIPPGPCFKSSTTRFTYRFTSRYSGIGAHAGFLYDFGDWVLGAETSFESYDARFSRRVVNQIPALGAGNRFRRREAIGILGLDLGPVLPHLVGGVAEMDARGLTGQWQSGRVFGFGVSVVANEHIMLTGRMTRTIYPRFFGKHALRSDRATLMVSFRF